MRFLATLLLALLLAPAPLPARTVPRATPAATTAQPADGPCVVWEGRKAKVLRFVQGRTETAPLGAGFRLDLPGLPPLRLDPAAPAPARAEFPLPAAVAAVSDIHGNAPGLLALLTAQGILDRDRRWAFGKGHLVVVGDMLDRGGQVTEVLWLLRSLEAQARAAGGAVHVLLGNHETMVLKGDLRYVNPKYLALPLPPPALYGPDTELGRWLRSRPVLLRLGEVLFVHGGPSAEFAAAHGDLAAVNAAARQEWLGDKGAVMGNGGPLWYRGLIPGAAGPGASDADVAAVLRAYGATTLVVGHTTLDQVTAFHGNRVYGIDAGLKDGKPGELWLQLGGRRFRGLADGSRIPLESTEPAPSNR